MPTRPRKHIFSADIVRSGGLYCVEVPAAVTKAVGVRGRVPVLVRPGRRPPFHGTLMPRGGGLHRLFLNEDARGGARTGRIAIELVVETRDRVVALPDDLGIALRDEDALAAWESFPPGKREHILRWVDAAVHEETRAKRIARAVEEALRRRERGLDALSG